MALHWAVWETGVAWLAPSLMNRMSPDGSTWFHLSKWQRSEQEILAVYQGPTYLRKVMHDHNKRTTPCPGTKWTTRELHSLVLWKVRIFVQDKCFNFFGCLWHCHCFRIEDTAERNSILMHAELYFPSSICSILLGSNFFVTFTRRLTTRLFPIFYLGG